MCPRNTPTRDTWAGTAEYRQLISGPMQVIGKTPGLLPAIVRYVECKCLLGGVTTSQGVQLFSNAGARRYYRGIVRNVEQTDEADLPEAVTKIADVEAADIEKFHQRLLRQSCFLPPERGHGQGGAPTFSGIAEAGWDVGHHPGPGWNPLRRASTG